MKGKGGLFEPNYWQGQVVTPDPDTRGVHQHAWGNPQYVVDHAREMGQIREECAFGCGATRHTDVDDLHHNGRRCS